MNIPMTELTPGRSSSHLMQRLVPIFGAALFLLPAAAAAPGQHIEKHFAVQGRPVVCIHNVANGRIEVKSSKNLEVVVSGTRASDKD